MATNRYTQVTPSQFNPLSLQEIMLVPTLKRRQHDASLKGMEQFRSNLLKADPHKKYQEEVLKIQNEINSEIDSEIERLNREGFNPSTRANLSKLNRKVNDLLAPTGRLGQINAHKKALNETYKNYLEESIKAGNSPEIAKYHADQALARHMQDPLYDEQGNVISFNIGAAPAFVDFDKFVFDAAKMAGMDERHWANASSYLDFDENSNRYVVNESAKGLDANNYAGLQAVVTYVNNTLKDKSSPLRRSIDYNLRNIDNLSILGKNITDIHRSSKSGITDRSSSKNNVNWAEREEESPSFDFLMNEEEYSPNEFTSRSYTDNVNRYRDLTSGRTLTIEEERELVNLEEFLENVEDKLAEDKNYQRLKTERDAKINALGLNENVAKWLKSQLNDNVTSQGLLSNTFTSDKLLETLYGSAINPHLHPDYKEGDYQKIRNFLRSDETQKNMEKIASEYNQQGHIKTTGYQLLPTTTKEKSEWAIVNHNFEKALKENPENLLNYLNIESVNMQDGLRRESSELDETDLKRIKELFNKSKDGSLEVVSFYTKGKSGKPEYVLKINTTEDNKVDLNRTFRFEKGQGTLGGGVPVYLRVSYDYTKGDVLETANGYLQKYLIGKGRKDPVTKRHHGTELALDIEANRVKSRLNKQYSESRVTWGDLINEDTDFREIDPFVTKELSKRLKKYYKNENPSDSEIREAIQKFLKDNQNRLIYLR